MTLVDYNALGVGVLDYVLQPTPIIPSSGRSPLDAFIVDQATFEAQLVLNSPSDLSILNRFHQYGAMETFYRMYYATGDATYRTVGNYLTEVYRDPQHGFPDYYNPTMLKAYCDSFGPANGLSGFGNPAPMGWAAYAVVNPAGDAASSRKIDDILKYQGGYYYQFYNMEQQPDSGGQGARERGATLNWLFMAVLRLGRNHTIQNLDKDTFVVRAYTLGEMLDETIDAMVQHVYDVGRPGFGWDFGPGLSGASTNYTGNMNLAGTAAEALVRVDRWKNRTGAPDARMYTELRKWLDWLEFGVAPGVTAANGSQWVAQRGLYNAEWQKYGWGWRYYHYQNGSYGDNGTHSDTETALAGHNLSAHAWGYARDANATDRQRFRSRIFEACQGIQDWLSTNSYAGGHFTDPRTWTECMKTWQAAFGLMEESDGGGVGPPPPPIDPPPPPIDPPPPPGGGALREHLTGWETGGHGECGGTVGTVQTSLKRTGLYALKLSSVASPARYSFPKAALAQVREFGTVHCRFHVTTNPSVATTFDFLALDNGAKSRGGGIQCTVSPSGQITLQGYNYQAGAAFGGTVTITPDVFVQIDLHTIIDATNGRVEWRVDAAGGGTSAPVNTGTGNILDWATFQPPTTNGLNLDVYYDDEKLDVNVFAVGSRVIARQGKSGTPTHNGFVKTGGAIHTVWSETPASAVNEAHSDGAAAQQTMLVADVAAGTDPVDVDDLLLHAWAVVVAKEIAASGGGGGGGALTIEGFAEGVTGGEGFSDVHVTNMNDSGAGSLRTAIASGNRRIVFDLGGTINAASLLSPGGDNMTIDFHSAPAAVTIKGKGFLFSGRSNILVNDARLEDMTGNADCYSFVAGSHDIALVHCSGINKIFDESDTYVEAGDGAFDVKDGSYNITAQKCLFGVTSQSLIGESDAEVGTRRVSVHHCAYIGLHDVGHFDVVGGGTTDRTPLNRCPNSPSMTETILDFRRNIVAFPIRANGSKFETYTRANCVGNAYIPAPATSSSHRADCILITGSGVVLHTAGNVELGSPALSSNINDTGNTGSALSAPAVTTGTLLDVFNTVGPRFPRSAYEQERLDLIAPFSPFT